MIPMAYHYALHPWDIDRLTISEFEIYAAGLEAMVAQRDKAEREAGRPVRKR